MKSVETIKKEIEFTRGRLNHYLTLANEANEICHIGYIDYRQSCLDIAERLRYRINALDWVLEERKNTRGDK